VSFLNDRMLNPQVDINEPTGHGSVFFARLPVGDYELYNVSFFVNRGQFGSTTFSAKTPFSIPFSIRENEATYLGAFLAHAVWGKNFFGLRIPAGGYFVVTDRFDRDYGVLRTKEGVGELSGTAKQVVDTGAANLPYFQAKPSNP
jgi:hypothetical protein